MTIDILILGSGPAGCAAAISALSAGLRVTMLELKGSAPLLLPGETLHPGAEPVLRQLGVWDDALLACCIRRHRGLWRERLDGSRTFEPYGEDATGKAWLGLQMDRAGMHARLRERVAELGGDLRKVPKIEQVITRSGAVTGVLAGDRHYTARFVLDATGHHAWLANQLQWSVEHCGPRQRLQFGWSDLTVPQLDGQPLFCERPDGWDWLAPLAAGRCAWAKLRRAAETSAPGIDYTWRIYRDCARNSCYLLGDAACLMDPSAANGVLRALMSGIYAVHVIRAVVQGSASTEEAEAEYRQWISRMFDSTQTVLSRRIHESTPA